MKKISIITTATVISKITRFTIFSYPGSSIATLSGGSHPNFRISQRPTQPRQ